MGTNWLRYSLFFLVLVILQIWILNRIHLFGYATPFFYIYFIIKLPADMGRNSLLFVACLLGLSIDFFSYTMGFNMLACTIMGFSRYYILNVFVPRDMTDSFVPSVDSFGLSLFIRYTTVLVVVHHIIFFIAESFSFLDVTTILLKIAGSSILSLVLIFGVEQLKLDFLKK